MIERYPISPLISKFCSHPQRPQVQSLVKGICDVKLSDYALIQNVGAYQDFYKRQIARENSDFDIQPRLSDFGVYDVTTMTEPQIREGQLTFYVEDTHRNPHKVTVDLDDKKVDCGPLPQLY